MDESYAMHTTITGWAATSRSAAPPRTVRSSSSPGLAELIEANETETDPDEIEDNLRFIEIGREKLEMIAKLLPGA